MEVFNGRDDELSGEGLINRPSNSVEEEISEDLHMVRVTFPFHNINNTFYDNVSNNTHEKVTC